jgi:hypothetical protein
MSDLTRLEIDEYGPAGADGYGFLIELHPDEEETPHSPPLVGHFAVTILRPAAAEAHPPTNLTLTKKVLTWLALYRFPDWMVLPLFDPAILTSALRDRNPPGFGYPGTTDWQWYGTHLERVDCPPLRGRCSLVICQAMPPGEAWDPLFALETITVTAKEYIARDMLARYRGET